VKKPKGSWANPKEVPARADKLAHLLVLYGASEMKAYPVSTLVNSPKNDSAECIREVPLSRTAGAG
jgi:putative SOS response-associated peptidase YedK